MKTLGAVTNLNNLKVFLKEFVYRAMKIGRKNNSVTGFNPSKTAGKLDLRELDITIEDLFERMNNLQIKYI